MAGISPTIRDGFPEGQTGWLTGEDSNFDTLISKNAFEMSAEFPLFWPKTRLGDFCSCKLWKWADAETVKTSECVPLHLLRTNVVKLKRAALRGLLFSPRLQRDRSR